MLLRVRIELNSSWTSTHALDLVFTEVRDLIHEDEWESSSEIDDFVHHEGHDSGGEDVVLHVGVPCGPHLLEDIEVDIVLSDVVEVVNIGDGGNEG